VTTREDGHHEICACKCTCPRDERQPEIDEMKRKLEIAREYFQKLEKGTHEEYPTCRHLEHKVGSSTFTEHGPPRTNGWEGWAKEIQETSKQIAREALEKLK
jgi:hypothetical protein